MQAQTQMPTQPPARTQNPVRTSSLENLRRTSFPRKRFGEQLPPLPSVAEEEVSPAPPVAVAHTNRVELVEPSMQVDIQAAALTLTSTPTPIAVAELPPTPSLLPSSRKKGMLGTLREKAASVSGKSLLGVSNRNVRGKNSQLPVKPAIKASKVLGLAVAEGEGRQAAPQKLPGLDAELLEDEAFETDEEVFERLVSCGDLVKETGEWFDGRIAEWERQRDEVLGIMKDLRHSYEQDIDIEGQNTHSAAASPSDPRSRIDTVDKDRGKSSDSSSREDVVPRSELQFLEDLLLASDAENGKLETEKWGVEKERDCLHMENQGLKAHIESLAVTNKGLEAQNIRLNNENVLLGGEREALEEKRRMLESVVSEMYGFLSRRPALHPQKLLPSRSGLTRASSTWNSNDTSCIEGANSGVQRMSFGSVQRSTGDDMALEEVHLMHVRNLIEGVDGELLNQCMGAKKAEVVEGEVRRW